MTRITRFRTIYNVVIYFYKVMRLIAKQTV